MKTEKIVDKRGDGMASAVEKLKSKGQMKLGALGKPLLVGTIAGALTVIVVLLICSFAVSCFSLPTAAMRAMAIITVAAGGFAGGYGAARAFRKKGLLIGGVVGVILALILTVAGVLFTQQAPAMQSLSKFAILMVSAMIGGILGVNAKSKRR